VDEAELYEAQTGGSIAGAALDLVANEPATDMRLAQLPNVLLTPHMAGVFRESVRRMSTGGAQSVVDVLNGSWDPSMVVNRVYSDN
jgi:D-3-phosphoglycerate dehydrogenase